jgi:uncharacterized protein with HEPN domain
MKENKNHLILMIMHMDKIIKRMNNKTFEIWIQDEILQDAVCMRLMALTECIKNFLKQRPEIFDQYPSILWEDIIRFREKITHHYEGINFDMVW